MPTQSPPKELSKDFQEKEQVHAQAVEKRDGDQEAQDTEDNTTYFWAPADKYQLANYVPEKWEGGRLAIRERSLSSNNHVWAIRADDDECEKKIKHIKTSGAFKAGIIIKCENAADAYRRTAILHSIKGIKQMTVTDVSSSHVSDVTDSGHVVEGPVEHEVKYS